MLNVVLSPLTNLIGMLNTRDTRKLDLGKESIEQFFNPLRKIMKDWKNSIDVAKNNDTYDEFETFSSTLDLLYNDVIPFIDNKVNAIPNSKLRTTFIDLSNTISTIIKEDEESDNNIFCYSNEDRQLLVDRALQLFDICDDMIRNTDYY